MSQPISKNVKKTSVPVLEQTIINVLYHTKMNPGQPFTEISRSQAGPSKDLTAKIVAVIKELGLFKVRGGMFFQSKLMKAKGEAPIVRLTQYTPSNFTRDILNSWHFDIPSSDRDIPKGVPMNELNDIWSKHVFTGMAQPKVYLHDTEQRLYSYGHRYHYQSMKKENRPYIFIDLEEAVYVDIKSSQLAIYKALHGELVEGYTDLYASDVFPDRKIAKTAFLKIIGSESFSCITWDVKKDAKPLPGWYWRYPPKTIVNELRRMHPCIDRIQEGDRLKVTHAEARIINELTFTLNKKGIIFLPLYDGFIIKKKELEMVMDEFKTQCRKELGLVLTTDTTDGASIDEQETDTQAIVDMVLEQFTVQGTNGMNAKTYVEHIQEESGYQTSYPPYLIERRRGAGDMAAKSTGIHLHIDSEEVYKRHDEGLSNRAIAKELGTTHRTIGKILEKRPIQPEIKTMEKEIKVEPVIQEKIPAPEYVTIRIDGIRQRLDLTIPADLERYADYQFGAPQ